MLLPSVLENNGGASNFGNRLPAAIPYALAFILSSLFLLLAASRLSQLGRATRHQAQLLIAVAALDLLVLITTFDRKANEIYYLTHDYLGVALFAYELFLSAWIFSRARSVVLVLWISVEAAGSLLGLLSLMEVLHLLFVGQMVGAIGFSLVLTNGFPRAIEKELARRAEN